METNSTINYKKLLDKKVEIYYNDILNNVSKIIGVIKDYNDVFLILENPYQRIIWVSIRTIVRIEEQKE